MMFGIMILFITFVFMATILLTNRYFYFWELKSSTLKLARELNLNIFELNFSFEQMVYFISLPTNIPTIKNAKLNDIVIEFDYISPFFPKLSGIKISIQSITEKRTLAYLPTKLFRLPALSQLLQQGKISIEDYLKISSYKLIHPSTIEEIKKEVYLQLQQGRI